MTVFLRVATGKPLAMDASTVRHKTLDVPNSDIRSTPMNMQPHFDTTREIIVIRKILADLVRTLQLIESDIEAEEKRAGISDQADAKYPMLARSLIERRDNLRMTIAGLEGRLIQQHEQVLTAA
ncbi:hypothetical protein [Bradyrhizobium sp. JYMT SZCCT0428]|uniref:hypothetical protein n=1 Tax=Bradyrhizobium sp. JYMT SZCCT0428 TaxID=2807673 RepID=UPI0020139D7B|nr:hypothetical protein [Bradyrhizobium sp. JYMT SZCCT0428]